MSKDRLVQLAAVAVMLVALVGSMLLINPINEQRRDLQLTFAVESNQGDPPQYALLAAGLGSFRGVAVNSLWYRAEMMKREGKFAEANTLATWITYLQPRFPHVWGFLAWNMAYNISVETFTPQERYDWVNKGVRLLREQGIPYNPNAVRLYRELGWILFHKIGGSTDDVNWYYKGEFAREWETLLGAAPEQVTARGVIETFLPIAMYGDRYFAVNQANRRVQVLLDEAAAADRLPAINADNVESLKELGVVPLIERLRDFRTATPPTDERGLEQLDGLLAAAEDQLTRAERDADSVFLSENPEAAMVADRLAELGLSQLDSTTLRALGQVLMFLRFRPAEVVATLPPQVLSDAGRAVLPYLVETLSLPEGAPAKQGLRDQLLPYLRAKVLIEEYNMDPAVMYRYMLTYGPLDWRHPHSHSLYWSRLGVEQYRDARDLTQVDILNTQRQALHSLQSLSDFGTVAFNPFNRPGQQIDLLPDPDFIDGYFTIVDETKAMADSEELGDRIRADAFAAGEENFLQKAVLYSYLYGEPNQAEAYYRRLINEFADEPHNQRRGWYELPLGDFVGMLIFDDDLGRPGMISLINSRLVEAFRKGLAVGNPRALQVFGRNLEIAQRVHAMYQEKYGFETGLGVGGGRLRMPPFPQMVEDAFSQFMLDPRHDLMVRINAYQTALRLEPNLPLASQSYRSWEQTVREQVLAMNFDPDIAIPVPPNVVENAEGIDQRQGGETILRQ
jgi:hypothetical protein